MRVIKIFNSLIIFVYFFLSLNHNNTNKHANVNNKTSPSIQNKKKTNTNDSRNFYDSYFENKLKNNTTLLMQSYQKYHEKMDAINHYTIPVRIQNPSNLNYSYTVFYQYYNIDGTINDNGSFCADNKSNDHYLSNPNESSNFKYKNVPLESWDKVSVKVNGAFQSLSKLKLDFDYQKEVREAIRYHGQISGTDFYSISASGILTDPCINFYYGWINNQDQVTKVKIGTYDGIYNYFLQNSYWSLPLISICAPIFLKLSLGFIGISAISFRYLYILKLNFNESEENNFFLFIKNNFKFSFNIRNNNDEHELENSTSNVEESLKKSDSLHSLSDSAIVLESNSITDCSVTDSAKNDYITDVWNRDLMNQGSQFLTRREEDIDDEISNYSSFNSKKSLLLTDTNSIDVNNEEEEEIKNKKSNGDYSITEENTSQPTQLPIIENSEDSSIEITDDELNDELLVTVEHSSQPTQLPIIENNKTSSVEITDNELNDELLVTEENTSQPTQLPIIENSEGSSIEITDDEFNDELLVTVEHSSQPTQLPIIENNKVSSIEITDDELNDELLVTEENTSQPTQLPIIENNKTSSIEITDDKLNDELLVTEENKLQPTQLPIIENSEDSSVEITDDELNDELLVTVEHSSQPTQLPIIENSEGSSIEITDDEFNDNKPKSSSKTSFTDEYIDLLLMPEYDTIFDENIGIDHIVLNFKKYKPQSPWNEITKQHNSI